MPVSNPIDSNSPASLSVILKIKRAALDNVSTEEWINGDMIPWRIKQMKILDRVSIKNRELGGEH